MRFEISIAEFSIRQVKCKEFHEKDLVGAKYVKETSMALIQQIIT
jgi:hypothetical protein